MKTLRQPAVNELPEKFQGTKRGNLVALRTGETGTELPTV
jgi:hypothetical protein